MNFEGGVHHHHQGDPEVDVIAAARTAPSATSPRVDQWDPQDLGVHTSLLARDASGLTPYLWRDHDRRLREALAPVAEPAARPMLVTVVGTSCVGKTRTLYEAVKDVVPTWPLVRPARNTSELRHLLEQGIAAGTVVWLDELRNYLTPDPPGAAVARYLLDLLTDPQAPPILFAGTTWRADLVYLMTAAESSTGRWQLSAVHELLGRTNDGQVEVPQSFTDEELADADTTDPRIVEAVATARHGQVAQVLGGGSLLWDTYLSEAPGSFDLEAKAVITAAMELRRIGYPNPLPTWAIEGTAVGYLPREQYACVAESWVAHGLEQAKQPVRGVSALTPSCAEVPGRVTGYDLHDYLLQQHLATHYFAPTSAALWETLVASASEIDCSVAALVGENALARGMLGNARALLEAATGHAGTSSYALSEVLARLNAQGELAARAAMGDLWAASRLRSLVQWCEQQGRPVDATAARALDEPPRLDLAAPHRDPRDASWLTEPSESTRTWTLFHQHARLREDMAADRLGKYEQIHLLDEVTATMVLLPASTIGDAGEELVVQTLRQQADAGDESSNRLYSLIRARQGDVSELRRGVARGEENALTSLIATYVHRRDLAGLRRLSAAGWDSATEALADLLYGRGDIGALRRLADRTGNLWAQQMVADLLRGRGDDAQLRRALESGTAAKVRRRPDQTSTFAELSPEQQHQLDSGASALLVRMSLYDVWARKRMWSELEAAADAEDHSAAERLAQAWAEHELLGSLFARARNGDRCAQWWAVDLLLRSGRLKEVRQHAASWQFAPMQIAGHLYACGNIDELRRECFAANTYASQALGALLIASTHDKEHRIWELTADAELAEWTGLERDASPFIDPGADAHGPETAWGGDVSR